MSEEFNPMPEAPVEKKSKKTMIIIIAVAVIVLCCCCVTLIAFYNYGDSILQALNL